jgi:hypothetical protein
MVFSIPQLPTRSDHANGPRGHASGSPGPAAIPGSAPGAATAARRALVCAALILLAALIIAPANAKEMHPADAAAYLCFRMEKTGLTTECEVSGWGETVEIRLDMGGAEARKLCPQLAKIALSKSRALAGKWQIKLFSPYSGKHPIAVCRIN